MENIPIGRGVAIAGLAIGAGLIGITSPWLGAVLLVLVGFGALVMFEVLKRFS